MSKRGRPREYSEEALSMLRAIFPEIKTERGLQNKSCELRAFGLLKERGQEIDNLSFLIDDAKQTFKSTILIELGRFEDDDKLLSIAAELCLYAKTAKKTVHSWANLVRKARLWG